MNLKQDTRQKSMKSKIKLSNPIDSIDSRDSKVCSLVSPIKIKDESMIFMKLNDISSKWASRWIYIEDNKENMYIRGKTELI